MVCRILTSICFVICSLWSQTIQNDHPQVTNLFFHSSLGVIHPEEGTLEFIVEMKRGPEGFGSTWDFLFSIVPAQSMGKGARTLFGIYIPPKPEKGLRVILRDGIKTFYLSSENFSWKPGTPFLLGVSWGRSFRLAINGEVVSETKGPCRLPDAFLPAHFMVDARDRFFVKSIRVRTREVAPTDYESNNLGELSKTPDTALLSTMGLTHSSVFATPWHRECPAFAKPVPHEENTMYRVGETPFLTISAVNFGEVPITWPLRISAVNLAGKTVVETNAQLTIPPGLEPARHSITLDALRAKGFYQVNCHWGGATWKIPMAVFPAPSTIGTMSNWLGQHLEENFSFGAYNRPDFRTLRSGGRNPFMWPRVEPEQGTWDWSLADQVVAEAVHHDTEILGILGYTPSWAGVEPDEALKQAGANRSISWKPRSISAFGNYIYRTVLRYKGKVKYWEIWNEIDWHPPAPPYSFTGSTVEYLALLKEAYSQAKKADPNCQILISGFGLFGDRNMPSELMGLGAAPYFDIFNFHGYAGPAALDPFRALLDRAKPGSPIWNSEHMWHEMNAGEKRNFLTAASPFWFLEKGVTKYLYMGMAEYYLDLSTRGPSIEYWILGLLQDQIRACHRFSGLVSFPGNENFSIRHELARSGGGRLLVLGTEVGEQDIYLDSSPNGLTDLFGETVPLSKTPTGFHFLMSNLVYITSDKPLRVISTASRGLAKLIQNGDFEEVEGDIATGGLGAGKARSWTFRERAKDPGGSIRLDQGGRSGRYALKLTSTGAGEVYAFQDIRPPAIGTFTLSAYFRKEVGSTAVPFLRLFDRSANKLPEATFEISQTEKFFQVKLVTTLAQMPTLPCALIAGIKQGQGSLILDDIQFVQGTNVPFTIDYSAVSFLDLRPFANQTWGDENEGDGMGGFADMGRHNFSLIKTGDRIVSQTPFRILSDEVGQRPSVVVLGGSVRPQFPAKVGPILVGTTVSSLSFLMTALWVQATKGEPLGKILFQYEDASETREDIVSKFNIDDWYIPAVDPKVSIAESVPLPDKSERAIFMIRWENPHPNKLLKSITFESRGKSVLLVLGATVHR